MVVTLWVKSIGLPSDAGQYLGLGFGVGVLGLGFGVFLGLSHILTCISGETDITNPLCTEEARRRQLERNIGTLLESKQLTG